MSSVARSPIFEPLREAAGDDDALFAALRNEFATAIAAAAQDLIAAATDERRRTAAHRLKGAAQTIGAGKLAELAQRVEECPSQLAQLLPAMERELSALANR